MTMEWELKFFLNLQTMASFLAKQSLLETLFPNLELRKSKLANTSIRTSDKTNKDLKEAEVDSTFYKSIIRSLLYLTASKPDIAFSVGVCARYHVVPKESHLKEAKKIIQYIHETIEFRLWYPFNTTCEVARYLDVD